MNSALLRTSTVLVIALTLTGCGRGWRDSLVLTGLRGKPDESKIVMNEPLVLPQSDEVVVPNSRTSADALRGDVYKVHEILYGQELATQEAERQFQVARQGSLSAGEAQLLQRARTVAGAKPVARAIPEKRKNGFFWRPKIDSGSEKGKRPLFRIKLPKLLPF